MGAGFWLREGVAERAEALAKAQFAARRDAHDCALLYLALGRRALLQARAHTSGVRDQGLGIQGSGTRDLRFTTVCPGARVVSPRAVALRDGATAPRRIAVTYVMATCGGAVHQDMHQVLQSCA